jgi:uncharacterized SAM-binding protein YcdF (DUF218 family)
VTGIDILEEGIRVLAEPSRVISYLVIGGVLLLFWKRHRKASRHLFAAALALYIVLGTGPVAFWLLGSLEFRYPPYEEGSGNRDVEDIVLLSGYAERNDDMPRSSHVNGASAIRILEAARVFRLRPGRRIIVSGRGEVPILMKNVLVDIGIPDKSISIEGNSGSTSDSAMNISRMLTRKRVILVTSAGHMFRSVLVFRNNGMHPVPAPTDFMTRRNYLATGYLPSPLYLKLSDFAVHEYIGILWYRKGAIGARSMNDGSFRRGHRGMPWKESG